MPFVGRKARYRPTLSIAPLQSKVLSLHLSCLVILSITACFPIRTRIYYIYVSPTAKLSFLASEHTQDPIWDCILIVQQCRDGWYTYSWDLYVEWIHVERSCSKDEKKKFQNPNLMRSSWLLFFRWIRREIYVPIQHSNRFSGTCNPLYFSISCICSRNSSTLKPYIVTYNISQGGD